MPPSTTCSSTTEAAPVASLQTLWYRPGLSPVLWPLLPLEGLFRALAALRRFGYRFGWLPLARVEVPVIVVGNISVGGTGKTPLVARLARLLQEAGYRPGIVTRGFGGRAPSWPQPVTVESDPALVGDEPVLLAGLAGCPVVAGPDRGEAARHVVRQGVDIIISDDGLQHYRLGRDLEIAVIDGDRRLGNGHCLPAGPLREPPRRLDSVDWVVVNGAPRPGEVAMQLEPGPLRRLDGTGSEPLDAWRGRRVHAVAGIGNPSRFFAMLMRAGLEVIAHPFTDHHAYKPSDLVFGDDLAVVMTEKDAVKCRGFAQPGWWALPVTTRLDPVFEQALLKRLAEKR